ncbi:MAG: hypothetical protein ACOY16_05920 [Chloroflexota bacterium]
MSKMLILIRGSGDVASAVAHCLFHKGYDVVLHDSPLPSATRRRMAFTDAIFDGRAELEGVEAVRADSMTQLVHLLNERQAIAISTLDFDVVLRSLQPLILVDARMRKHVQPEPQIHLAPLTIGLGPNFIAGETVHLAIETAWGEDLGKVIRQGATKPLAGEPQAIAGHARDRYVYAPISGIFETNYQIGDTVVEGQTVANIGEVLLKAPIGGVLRGLTRKGVPVVAGTKVIEVDPRREGAQVAGIGERPRRIAEGTCKAVQRWIESQEGL